MPQRTEDKGTWRERVRKQTCKGSGSRAIEIVCSS